MRENIKDWLVILVPSFIVFSFLIFLFYILTNIGYSNTINGYVPMYAPAWLEALTTTLFIPLMVGFSIYDKIYEI